jgi:hypothetical protein
LQVCCKFCGFDLNIQKKNYFILSHTYFFKYIKNIYSQHRLQH